MGFCLEVRGDYACFTRPEMKVERVSYEVITPSAARGIFEAILWKPAIAWRIHKIEVLEPIRWVNIRRNEVGAVLSVNKISSAIKSGVAPALYIESQRQQRAGLFLRDVAYRLHASFELTDKAEKDDNAGKFANMFRRRAGNGQCVNQPYLGTREFSCDFRLVEVSENEPTPIDENRSLGWILYDMDFSDPKDIRPLFFHAELKNGVVEVPPRHGGEVRG